MQLLSHQILGLLAVAGCLTSVCAEKLASFSPEYHEQLDLRPLPLNGLLASFNFRAQQPVADIEAQNFRLFPRSLGQLLEYSGTKELHLRFALGRWDAQNWGARPWDGKKEGGTGVELWAWLDATTDEEAGEKWRILTNALSGLFCASLNFIDETRTTRPVLSFAPDGDHLSNTTSSNMKLFHGVLPHEVVCTENLTPFLKMLPCKGKAGIATLLDGHKLFDASWQSMSIDVRPVCKSESSTETCVLEVDQTIDMVLDIPRSKRPRDNPIPRPIPADELNCDSTTPYYQTDACYPIDNVSGQSWALSELFGKTVRGTCPLTKAGSAPVCITIPESRDVTTSGASNEFPLGDTKRCFLLSPDQEFDLSVPHLESDGTTGGEITSYVTSLTPQLYVERSLTGYGQEHGGVRTLLTNPSSTETIQFVYMESLPWFMRVYVHSLNARIQGAPSPRPDLIKEVHYRPALDRVRGSQLEIRMEVPPASTVVLAYDFEKAILRYTEYPPDANRGFDVAAAMVRIIAPVEASLRTTSMLLYLPTPDFSMPYNVIIFTSTAIALVFGGMYNLLVRRMVAEDEAPTPFLRRQVAALKGAVAKLKGKKTSQEALVVGDEQDGGS
ncbi:Subunit of the glycosylphosphatidylinositol transamidase complex-like protein [Ceratocystis pirilliformis]|uniref:Subunit of the glycosylphosphatidylinositol transamidase complex-like protein n=1 Tax=Ceratocystis pirilliformis TaxID=259994 RepID=A0ABR3ZLV8_9PEZI